MKKFSVLLTDDQIETINKVLAFEGLAPVDLEPLNIIQLSDVMVLTISRVAWLHSIDLSRLEIRRILDLLDDVIHCSCSKSARSKSNEIINNK